MDQRPDVSWSNNDFYCSIHARQRKQEKQLRFKKETADKTAKLFLDAIRYTRLFLLE